MILKVFIYLCWFLWFYFKIILIHLTIVFFYFFILIVFSLLLLMLKSYDTDSISSCHSSFYIYSALCLNIEYNFSFISFSDSIFINILSIFVVDWNLGVWLKINPFVEDNSFLNNDHFTIQPFLIIILIFLM